MFVNTEIESKNEGILSKILSVKYIEDDEEHLRYLSPFRPILLKIMIVVN
jgi:hypothetical protein